MERALMMKTLLLNSEGDFVFEQGSFFMAENDLEIAQSVSFILGTAKGEWFLNPDLGLDREALLTKNFNESLARDSIIEALSYETRITAVEEIKFSKLGRTLFADIVIRKQDDTTLQLEGVSVFA
jgi:phage baseplate assembly protein W